MTEFEVPLWVASSLIFVTAFLALTYNVWRDRRASKKSTVMSMYAMWSSAELARRRSVAAKRFNDCWAELNGPSADPASASTRKVPISEIYAQDGLYTDFGTIEHFFDDLGRLAKEGELDKKLSRALFKDVTDHWRSIFERIEWSTPTQREWWESLGSNMGNIYKLWGADFVAKGSFYESPSAKP